MFGQHVLDRDEEPQVVVLTPILFTNSEQTRTWLTWFDHEMFA